MNLKEKLLQKISRDDHFYSFEVHPPKMEVDVDEFLQNVTELCTTTDPLFFSLTWHSTLNPHELSRRNSSLSLANSFNGKCKSILMPHLTCDVGTLVTLKSHINNFKMLGVKNIFALAGDSIIARESNNVRDKCDVRLPNIRASEFVRRISANHSNIVIAVAGYPDTHPKAASRPDDIANLRRKVEAGAHFVITQFFFRPETFVEYVGECRQAGVNVPIIPGIFLFKSGEMLLKITQMNNIRMPTDVVNTLQKYGENTKLIKKYSLHLAYELGHTLLNSRLAQGIHIFTMNQTGNVKFLLNRLGLVPQINSEEYRQLRSTESIDHN